MSDGQERPPGSAGEVLIADVEFPWGSGNPYEVLNRRLAALGQPALGPSSPMRDVHDAFFDLQVGASADIVAAWHQLKAAPRRLVVDFFHYPVPDFRVETIDPATLERPMPVTSPDPLALAPAEVELDAVRDAPASVQPHELPREGLVDVGVAELSPLCGAAPQLSEIIEVVDDTP